MAAGNIGDTLASVVAGANFPGFGMTRGSFGAIVCSWFWIWFGAPGRAWPKGGNVSPLTTTVVERRSCRMGVISISISISRRAGGTTRPPVAVDSVCTTLGCCLSGVVVVVVAVELPVLAARGLKTCMGFAGRRRSCGWRSI